MDTYSESVDNNIAGIKEDSMIINFPVISEEVGFNTAFESIKDGIPFNRISGLYPRMALGLENGSVIWINRIIIFKHFLFVQFPKYCTGN